MDDAVDFMLRLSEDNALLESFKSDPKGTMEDNGVPRDVHDAMMSKDPKKIRAALEGNSAQKLAASGIVIVFVL